MRKEHHTTRAVLNSQIGKKQQKEIKRVLLSKEAERLGIPVIELIRRKALEGEAIRTESARKNVHVVNVGPPLYQQEQEKNESHGWDSLFKHHYS